MTDSGKLTDTLGRREYLKLSGTAVAGSAASSVLAQQSDGVERRGIAFEKTVDMVAEAGCDPSGTDPCDARIEDAAASDTLLTFPPGTYRLTSQVRIENLERFGMLGEGDVTFEVVPNFHGVLLHVDLNDRDGLLFENIDIDMRASGATPGLKFRAGDGLVVADVEMLGQGIHPDSEPCSRGTANNANPGCDNPRIDALSPLVTRPDGTGLVENFVAKNAGLMGAYSRTGIGLSPPGVGVGTITITDCHLEGFPGGGIYASRHTGPVHIEGGVYRNNDVFQLRIGSGGSYVDGAAVGVDMRESDSPNPDDALNQRGIQVMHAKFDDPDPAPEIRNCDIEIASTTLSDGAIAASGPSAEFVVTDTRIRVDEDGTPAVWAKDPTTAYGGTAVPAEPWGVTLQGVSITGDASNAEAIRLINRTGSTIADCCLHQTGRYRDGIRLDGCDGTDVTGTTVDVTGDLLVGKTDPTTNGVSAGGSCPSPTFGAAPTTDDASVTATDEDDESEENDEATPHRITIVGEGPGGTDYTFATGGEYAATERTDDSDDSVGSNEVRGHVEEGTKDAYYFSGTFEDPESYFEYDNGDLTVTVDGELRDPDSLGSESAGSEDAGRLPHRLTVVGEGPGGTDYTFATGGEYAATERTDLDDTLGGAAIRGYVEEGTKDAYYFSGTFEDPESYFEYDNGDLTVTVDGELRDPDSLGE